jgi:hypothetical protein
LAAFTEKTAGAICQNFGAYGQKRTGIWIDGTFLTQKRSKVKSKFFIVLNVRTAGGFVRFGEFDLGDDQEAVEALYSSLEGREAEDESAFLHLDLVEMRRGLPLSLRVLSCSAAELGRNVCAITRQVFQSKNLKDTI